MRLTQVFFNRRTTTVARQLLGKYLVRRRGRSIVAAMITETEAYHGPQDRASHASRGRTPRTDIMFGPPGFTYVYLIYGMYHCLNFTTMRENFPAAVLVRGVDMLGGNGPGRLCKLFDITKAQNGLSPGNGELWLEDRGIRVPRGHMTVQPRVGVDYAGPEWASKPWRFIYNSKTR